MGLFVQVIGYTLTAISAIIYVPQVVKVVRRNSAVGLSKNSFVGVFVGTMIWITYASIHKSTNPLEMIPPYLTNAIMLILQNVILFYIFRDNKKWFYLLTIICVCLLAGSIAALTQKFDSPLALSFVFVIIASLFTGFFFFPQTFKIFRLRKIENYSMTMSITIFFVQIGWLVFWGCKSTLENNLYASIIDWLPYISSAPMAISQLLIIYIHFKFEKKPVNNL